MTAQYPYPELILVPGDDPPWRYAFNSAWFTDMNLTWLRILKGWTRSEDFAQKVETHGLTRENIDVLIARFNDQTLRILAKGIEADPESRFRRLVKSYYYDQHVMSLGR